MQLLYQSIKKKLKKYLLKLFFYIYYSLNQKTEYIKGATTDPCVNIINAPISTRVIIKGASQYFLRTFKKSQMSLIKSMNASMIKKFLLDQLYDLSCFPYKTSHLLFSVLEGHNQTLS